MTLSSLIERDEMNDPVLIERKRTDKPDQSVDELCNRAAAILRKAGFEFRNASMKTEACYYALPGRQELIRLASHKRKLKRRNNGGMNKNVVAKITFTGNCLTSPGYMRISDIAAADKVIYAIGQYMAKLEPSIGADLAALRAIQARESR